MSEVNRLFADNSKAKELLGWEPSVDFDEGLQNVIEWIKKNLGNYKSEIYNI